MSIMHPSVHPPLHGAPHDFSPILSDPKRQRGGTLNPFALFPSMPHASGPLVCVAYSVCDLICNRISTSSAPSTDATQIQAALASGGVPWRPIMVKHPREDILFDLIERMEGTFSRRGTLSRSSVGVRIDATSRLNNSPLVSLTLDPKACLTLPSFHPCVRVRPWHKKGVLEFVPPDGRFTLAHFAVERAKQPSLPEVQAHIPFKLECKLRVLNDDESRGKKAEFRLDLETLSAAGKAGYGRVSPGQSISQLVLSFQVPEDATDMDCSLFSFAASAASTSGTSGAAQEKKRAPDEAGVWLYDPKLRVLRWALGTIRPDRAVRMRGSFGTRDPAPVVASNVGVQFTVVDAAGHSTASASGHAPLTGLHTSAISVSSSANSTLPNVSGMEGFGSDSKAGPNKHESGSQGETWVAGGGGDRSKVYKGARSVLMTDLEYRWA